MALAEEVHVGCLSATVSCDPDMTVGLSLR